MKLTSRKLLASTCAFSVLAAGVARFGASGWFMMLGIWILPLVLIGHCVVHLYCTLGRRVSRRCARLLIASDATLLGAFLFQWDMGDDYGWLTITKAYRVLTGGRPGSESFSLGLGELGHLAFDALLLVPVFVLWRLALRETARTEREGTAPYCLACGNSIGALDRCPDCGAIRPAGELGSLDGRKAF